MHDNIHDFVPPNRGSRLPRNAGLGRPEARIRQQLPLPQEVWSYLLEFLPPFDRCRIKHVCLQLKEIVMRFPPAGDALCVAA